MGGGTMALQNLLQVRVADALLKHLLCGEEVNMDVDPGQTHTPQKPPRRQ